MPVERLDRGTFFWCLIILAGVNGLGGAVASSVVRSGWQDAILNTFDISAIVWVALTVGVLLIRPVAKSRPISNVDMALGLACLVLTCIPAGPPSWIALTLSSGWVLLGEHSATQRKGLIIVLATTVTMFWSRLCFQLFADTILSIDASFVSALVGTERSGNMVRFVNGPGYLVIYPTCSSLANISLAVLCWITLVQLVEHKWRTVDIVWGGVACFAVIGINVSRMGLMAQGLDYYEAIHSPRGDLIGNLIFVVVVLAICLGGVRREIFNRA
jgi:hypothetical protein